MTPRHASPRGPAPAHAPGATLFQPRDAQPASDDSRAGPSLPKDLKDQATQRIRVVAIVYSLAFLFADVLPSIFMGHFPMRLQHPVMWFPTTLSIAAGLAFAAFISTPHLGWNAKVNLGLAFEVVGSFGIALAMYLDVPDFPGVPLVFLLPAPSWVAIWMLFYSIMVPAPPWRALLALIASASAPVVVIWLVLRQTNQLHLLPPTHFLVGVVIPQSICAFMAWVGARTIYKLGKAVARARELGSYRLVERLGEGGMGEVWRATHQLLAREAAIKFIRPESITGASPEEAKALLQRFELEARATASLTSAHTIDIYDFGVSDDGTFYYVMELLDGLDCDHLVRRFGPLPPGRVIHFLRQVCESLEEAHGKGLIHRDVKPANIYACRSGRRWDFIKVLDFGLVAEHRAAPAPDPRITLPDQTIGTPHFMPPEVALGQPIDGRTDLYGVGCVAYWLATGKPVFDGAGYYEIVSKHMHAAPDPPSRHAPNGLPPELDALILMCLEKQPERRPSGARELGRRLAALAVAEPWREEQAEDWWAARREHGPVRDVEPLAPAR